MNVAESAALDHLYRRALPDNIPGAWIRAAIDRMREEATMNRKDERMDRSTTDLASWPLDDLLDHLCELAMDARTELFACGAIPQETAARMVSVRAEIQWRARVAARL